MVRSIRYIARFLLIGGLLLLAQTGLRGYVSPSKPEISIPRKAIDELVLRAPSLEALRSAVHAAVVDAVLVEEAFQRGFADDPIVRQRLTRNIAFAGVRLDPRVEADMLRRDPVVRRRLVQRMQFQLENEASALPPTASELDEVHAQLGLRLPPSLSFRQLFFDRTRRGERGAMSEAYARLTLLREGVAPDPNWGDTVIDAPRTNVRERGVAKYFGDAFAQRLFASPLRTWHGPIESSQGVHLVYVSDRRPGRSLTPEEAHSQVVGHIMTKRKQAALEAGIRRLSRNYRTPSVEDLLDRVDRQAVRSVGRFQPPSGTLPSR